MTGLPEKIVAIDQSLTEAAVPHAFGGALALAWCTRRARGTIDIDLNIFSDVTEADVARVEADGQVRLWWEGTPVDVFLNTTEFHDELAARVRVETFADRRVPFLSCTDLAVFKAFFNRTKDWADLEAMIEAGALDVDRVLGVLLRTLGPRDERIERLRGLT